MTQCKLIACELHDYLEIACMYGYRVKLELKDGQSLEGNAIDLITTTEKREFLLLDDGQKQLIELTQLIKMTTLTPNASFKEVAF
ncbi:Rho-binding antiterminator [Methylomicrobium sp. Wu6]|uniref:Rho-binding antiterminator n=1 Tax=Methylomicrobium sp. Wu6 TaxID=3107928 RepID=UPI002DD6AF02|nr:Rho-binding antiterminator [Methylomicrobium sp. Wu6]MEC4750615.1 Rho-binding antiterminator [Methylomicrobium sp. Wu6]